MQNLIMGFNEFVNESNTKDLPIQLVDADKGKNGWASIVDTPIINKNEICISVHAGDSTVRSYLNKMIKSLGFKAKFIEMVSNVDTHDYCFELK